jgi:hypothetical protein
VISPLLSELEGPSTFASWLCCEAMIPDKLPDSLLEVFIFEVDVSTRQVLNLERFYPLLLTDHM